MTNRIFAFLALMILAEAGLAEPPIMIINANLISPERAEILADAWVKIDGDSISAVGTGPADSSQYDIVDAAGAYLVPGLIDSHVHLYHATGLKRKYSSDFDALYAGYMEQQPRSFLYFGFTTVIELNADAEDVARFESAPLHPRVVHCGQGVILSDGFMALELEGDPIDEVYPGYLIDSHEGGFVPAHADPQRHTPKAAVDYVIEQGGRCIKLYYEEALWWPGGAPPFRLPSIDIVRDLVTEAHARGLPVILHATTPAGHRFALETRIDVLAHGMWEWPDQAFDAMTPKPDYAQIAREIAASEIKMQPSFNTIRNTASLFMPELLADPGWTHVVPDRYLNYLKTDAQSQRIEFIAKFGSELDENLSIDDLPSLMAAFNLRYEQLVGRMSKDGAELLFGTDTAVGGFGWASPPGLGGYWEVQAWSRAGISPRTLFESLTIGNARAFGLDREIGSVEVGKRADLLLLRENPLAMVDAYNTIEMVILGGNRIARKTLSATAEKAGNRNLVDVQRTH